MKEKNKYYIAATTIGIIVALIYIIPAFYIMFVIPSIFNAILYAVVAIFSAILLVKYLNR